MKALADALVHAVAYLHCRPDSSRERVDGDIQMLETVAAYLAAATDDEKDALAEAAQRAFEKEQSGECRPEYLDVYSTWMECMCGDGWEGNARVSAHGLANWITFAMAPAAGRGSGFSWGE